LPVVQRGLDRGNLAVADNLNQVYRNGNIQPDGSVEVECVRDTNYGGWFI
jgi:hypothetical protein